MIRPRSGLDWFEWPETGQLCAFDKWQSKAGQAHEWTWNGHTDLCSASLQLQPQQATDPPLDEGLAAKYCHWADG